MKNTGITGLALHDRIRVLRESIDDIDREYEEMANMIDENSMIMMIIRKEQKELRKELTELETSFYVKQNYINLRKNT